MLALARKFRIERVYKLLIIRYGLRRREGLPLERQMLLNPSPSSGPVEPLAT